MKAKEYEKTKEKVIKIFEKAFKEEMKREINPYEIWLVENAFYHAYKILKGGGKNERDKS